MPSVSRQILQLEREQAEHFNQRQLRPILAQFDPGFVGFSSTRHERIRGRRALEKTFLYYLRQSPRLTYRIAQPQVKVVGKLAVATFYWTVALGKRGTIHGRGTHVFVKRARRWRILHEHFSRAH